MFRVKIVAITREVLYDIWMGEGGWDDEYVVLVRNLVYEERERHG